MITAKKFEPEHDLQHPAGSGHMDCLGSSAATLMLFKGKKVGSKCETGDLRVD